MRNVASSNLFPAKSEDDNASSIRISVVIGVPALRLERDECGQPAVAGWKVREHCAILKRAVVVGKFPPRVSLIHVDVMNTFGEFRAEGEELCRWIVDPSDHHVVNLVMQIARGQSHRVASAERDHVVPVDYALADKVE